MSRQRILSLYPYLYPGTECWVFDDERTGLKEEAFVEGTSEMITRVVERKKIPHAARGFGGSSATPGRRLLPAPFRLGDQPPRPPPFVCD